MIGKVVASYSKNNKITIFTYLCIVLIGVVSSFYLIPKYTSQLMSSFNTGAKSKDILIAVVVTYIIGIFMDITKKYVEDTIIPDFTRHVREYLYKTVMKSHKSDRQVELGKLSNVIAYLPYVIRSIVIEVIRTYLPYAIAIIILIGYFISLDVKFGILQIVTLVVYILTVLYSSNSCIDTAYDSQNNYMNLAEKIQDKIMNIDSVYAAEQETIEIQKYNKENKKNIQTYQKNLRKLWKLRCYEDVILCLSFVIFNFMIYKTKIPKKTVVALYVAEIYYFLRILENTQGNILGLFTLIGEGRSMSEFMNELEIHDSIKSNKFVHTKISSTKPSLVITDGWFRYDRQTPWILKEFNLTTHHGDRIWIKGSSGCGKSTLFKLIMGGLTLQKGSVQIFGNSNKSIVRQNISVVDQHTKLFHDTVLKNITYGNNATESDIRKVLKLLDTNIYDKLSKGLHTDAGVGGENLSGGQRQLTILLRCYFRPATIVLMDEPISAIDDENIEIILKTIDFIANDRTLLVISHNERIRDVTNKVIEVC